MENNILRFPSIRTCGECRSFDYCFSISERLLRGVINKASEEEARQIPACPTFQEVNEDDHA